MKRLLYSSLLLICITSHTQVPIDDNFHLFQGKNIVITGGTGYLGRAIITQLLKYNPKKIILFSRDEVKHFNISKIFGNSSIIENVIGDIRDYECLIQATKGADIVFHAGALKRIDLMETNTEECVKTNIMGSLNVFNACVANNVPKVVFISTDKACLPINIYGASKFVSEKIFTNYDANKINTKFIVVRYGNVLESTGSVIPIFSEKIKNGEIIPLTDPEMTRFIIAPDEAVELIFDALRYGAGGETFIKKLISFKITDLIEILKEKFNASNPVKIVGLRPGEKIHEIMFNESEVMRAYEYKNYYILRSTVTQWADQSIEPIYIKEGKQVDGSIKEFSSGNSLISKESVKELFESMGLL